jgi:hypothetical protein
VARGDARKKLEEVKAEKLNMVLIEQFTTGKAEPKVKQKVALQAAALQAAAKEVKAENLKMWAAELKVQEKTRQVAKAVAVAKVQAKDLRIVERLQAHRMLLQALGPQMYSLSDKHTLRGKNPLQIYRDDLVDQQCASGSDLHTPWFTIVRDFNALTADQRRHYDERSVKSITFARHNRYVDRELLLPVKGSMSKPVPAGETMEEAVESIFLQVPLVMAVSLPDPLPHRVSAVPGAPRNLPRVYIRRGVELRKYGFTEGCRGCRFAQVTEGCRGHSEQCRNRIGEAMKRDRDDTVTVEESDRRRQKIR